MNPADVELFRRVLKDRSGLVLTDDKSYLLESRLAPVARRRGLASVGVLARELRGKPDGGLVRDIVEAMTTNESLFFRDVKPFEQFRTIVLPYILKTRAASRTIRLWSAACAAGQEPYSLAMILHEERASLGGWQVGLVASDLSSEMVERAKAGVYTQFEVQRGLALKHLVNYFEPEADRWHLKPLIRDMVHFRVANLLDDLSSFGRMDAIFCRNVLIYFDQATKEQILDRLARLLPRDGFLFLGGAETTLGISTRFEPVPDQRGLYRLAA